MTDGAYKILSQSNAVGILVKLYGIRDSIALTNLWKEVGSGYTAIKNEVLRLEAADLVTFSLDGKIQSVELTPLGRKVAKELSTACETYDTAMREMQ